MADLYDLQAALQGGNAQYLAEDPLYATGINIAKMQMPAAKTNTQAILFPVLQGLLSGGLAGFGKDRAFDKAYTQAQANPWLRSLQGYQEPTRPDNWEPDRAKSDIIMSLLSKKMEDEKAIESAKQQADLQKALTTQGVVLQPDGSVTPLSGYAAAKAGIEQATKEAALRAEMGSSGGVPGVPAGKQSVAAQEIGTKQQLEQSKEAIDQVYSQVADAKAQGMFGRLGRTLEHAIPVETDHERKVAAAQSTLVAMAQKILKAEPNAKMQERIIAMTPSRSDSPEAVLEKAKLAKQFLEGLSETTPTLDIYGVTPNKSQVSREAAIAELKRRGLVG